MKRDSVRLRTRCSLHPHQVPCAFPPSHRPLAEGRGNAAPSHTVFLQEEVEQ